MTEHETLRGGRYEVLGLLGEGTQGRTLRALEHHEGRHRLVAVKRFDVRGARSWKDFELAEREARVLQSLQHPNLPRYIDTFEEGGALYLVMELIEGESVASRRQGGVVFSEDQVARFLRDVSGVLDYLHRRPVPVIHRDLKPGNVIQRPDGSFAFVDFGAVRDKLRPEGGSTVVGTFGYMAPEQFQGRALPASDVYSVGATALAMLTGREPEALPHKGLAIDVRAALRGVRGPLVGVLERMLEPDPDRRGDRIAPLLASLGVPAPCRPARRPRSRATETSWVDQAQRWREMALNIELASRKERRRAVRQARREARRLTHLARHGPRERTARPWPIALFLTALFSVGIVAVALATGVIVPFVLLLLSRFFAREGLVAAAATVRDAGRIAVAHIARAQAGFWEVPDPSGAADRVRVDASAPAPDTRVATEPEAPEEAETVDDVDLASPQARTGG